jgi:hypothetical protein
MVSVPSITSEFLKGGVSSALTGLGASNSKVVLSQIAIASIVNIIDQQTRRLDEVQGELKDERAHSRELDSSLAAMRSRADIAETRLSEAEGASTLRDVVLTVGGVILGASTVLYEKLGVPATIVAVGVGVALVVAVMRSRTKRAAT